MRLGINLPQGWMHELAGWEPAAAWARIRAVAQLAERLGFDSVWLADHFQTEPEPTDEPVFESFTTLSAIAAITRRIRLGHNVICAGYRNPALVAKMISTLDVISGGRVELGIGAGWLQAEWDAFGYRFPSARERLAILRESLEVITRMFGPGRANFEGTYARVREAVNQPKGMQKPRLPIIVGGNGPKVTFRLAAQFADELNLDGRTPDEVRELQPTIRNRCEEIGRDPESLRLSVWVFPEAVARAGSQRSELLGAYRALGVSRVILPILGAVKSDRALYNLARDAEVARALAV